MSEPLFHVIADGRPVAGFDPATVVQQLAEQLKLAPAQAQRLVTGQPIIAKRAVTRAIADKYCARLSALGVQVHIEADAAAASNPASETHMLTPMPVPTPAEWPELNDFFAGIVIPTPCTRSSARYVQQVLSASLQTACIASAYSCIAIIAVAIFIFYSWHFGYLLGAPPLLFSIPVFIIPWLALLFATLLLLRPFFPQGHSASATVPLHAHLQPQLFHWLAELCERIGVAMPEEVSIGAQVTDEVTPHQGTAAFRHGRYHLRLSLPSLDNNTLCNSTALLAATLGTQAKPAALRCRRLQEIVAERCAACLENRDWLNEKIAELESHFANRNLSMAFNPLRKIIAQHNRLLARFYQQLMNAQQRFARHTTLEADRLQTLLIGAENFTENLIRQHKLTIAYAEADALNREDRIDSGLVADLPALIRFYVENFDPQAEQLLRKQWRETHGREVFPTAGERIEAAQQCKSSAVLTSALPATTLLKQQETLARQITETLYIELDLTFDADTLTPTDAIIFTASENLLHKQQASLYFNNWFKPFRFWRVADYALIRDMPTNDAAQQLNVCINEIRRLTPDRMRLLNEYERLQNQINELLLGQVVLAQGRNFQFRYVIYDGANLQPLLEERQQQMLKVMEQLATQETIMGGRIILGLRLSGQAPADAENLHKALQLGVSLESRLYKLTLDVSLLEQLLQRHAQREADYALPIKRLEEKIHDATLLILERLKEIPYPPDPRYAKLGDYVTELLAKPQSSTDAMSVLGRAQRLLHALYGFNEALTRLTADCGTIAEEAYNIEPIKLIG
jgi:hypothetical protein